MKKKIIGCMMSLCSLFFVTFVCSCESAFKRMETVEIKDISSDLDYGTVSKMAFMGGSVLYNSKNPSTSQLAEGVCLPVRLGKTKCEEIDSDNSIYSDIASEAVYGYITISEVNSSLISFKYYEFLDNGKFFKESFYNLKLGDELDINADGINDLKYRKAPSNRQNAKTSFWLTFLSDKKTQNTSMFSVIPEQYSRSAYPCGLMGINPDGKYIVSKYESDGVSRSAVQGIMAGDYVMDSQQGIYQKVTGCNSYKIARAIEESDLETVSDDEIDFLFELEDFYGFECIDAFVNALPKEITDKYNLFSSNPQIISALNEMLLDKNLVKIASEKLQIDLEDDIKEVINNINSLSNDELIAFNRLFLSFAYSDVCPAVNYHTSDITDVLPLLSLNISNETEEEVEAVNRAASYSDYTNKKKTIEDEFNKYQKFKLLEEKSNELKMNAFLGIGGSFNITWSNAEGSAAALLFIQTELVQSISKTKTGSLYKGKDKEFFKKNFLIGVVPFTVSVSGRFDIPYAVTANLDFSSEYFLGFTGLYGAKVAVGANYGLRKEEWFKIFRMWIYKYTPYINPYVNGSPINMTEYYIGLQHESGNMVNYTQSLKFSVSPTVTISPAVGIANNAIFFKAPVSNALELGAICTVTNLGTKPVSITGYMDYVLGIKGTAGVCLDVPIIGKWEKSFEPFTIMPEKHFKLASFPIY